MLFKVNSKKLKERVSSPIKRITGNSPDPDEEWKKPKSHHGAFGHFDNPVKRCLVSFIHVQVVLI
jgi:hypothetical protein